MAPLPLPTAKRENLHDAEAWAPQAELPLLSGYLRAACVSAWIFGFQRENTPCDKSGIMMSNVPKAPGLADEGVTFTVLAEYKFHDCPVSPEALSNLSQLVGKELDSIATFKAYEARITGVAQRLALAGIAGSPVLVGPLNFRQIFSLNSQPPCPPDGVHRSRRNTSRNGLFPRRWSRCPNSLVRPRRRPPSRS